MGRDRNDRRTEIMVNFFTEPSFSSTLQLLPDHTGGGGVQQLSADQGVHHLLPTQHLNLTPVPGIQHILRFQT